MCPQKESALARFEKKLLRKRYLIYPKFQLTLVALQTLITLSGTIFLSLYIYFSFEGLKEMGQSAELEAGHP